MAVANAHIGTFSYFLTEDDSGDPLNERVFSTAAWQGNWACEYTPVTPSGSGNGTLVLPVIGTATWTVTFPLNTAEFPATFGLEEGVVIYEAFFERGDSGSFDTLERTTLTSIQFINNNVGDAVRVVLTGMGGRVV